MSGPIFITGASRTGTELLRTILNRHPQIAIAAETHYFADPRARLGDPSQPTQGERDTLLDHFLRVAEHGYGLPIGAVSGPERKALSQAWAKEGPGADALFAAFCKAQARDRGKTVWGEKTPRHLFRIDQILAAFPDARIIVCQRDPRASVISYRDWRNNWFERDSLDAASRSAVEKEELRASRSYNITVASLLWRSCVEAGEQALKRHGPQRIHIHRYENLISDPEATAEALFDWLQLPFTNDVLDVNIVNSSYTKFINDRGIDRSTANKWRERASNDETAFIEMLTRPQMHRLGYQSEFGRPAPKFVAKEVLSLFPDITRIFMANRTRMGSIREFLSERLKNLA